MRALIVDDERLARNELRRLLGRHPEIEIVGEAANASQARKALQDLEPELLFLDVQMPGETGLDLLASLDSVPLVVFTTAYDEYALRAFDARALDYLVKPIDPRWLATSLARLHAASQRLAAKGSASGVARTPSGFGTTTRRLHHLLEEELCGGTPTLEHLAARFHMSARTLHRRLGEEGTTFRRAVAEVRRELAERHLRERRLAICEISFLLGFSEASAFHRAFKRWTGWRPLAFRHAQSRESTVPRDGEEDSNVPMTQASGGRSRPLNVCEGSGVMEARRPPVSRMQASDHKPRKALVERARDRQAAASYLRAAAATDEPVERERLRRRAAELILPRVLSAVGVTGQAQGSTG